MLGEGRHADRVRFLVRASTTAGTTSATGSRSTSIQRMRGSRRNHRSWRTANCRVRTTIEATAASSVDPPVEVLEQLLVAERLTRRSATSRRHRPAPPRPAARHPSSCRRGRPSARPAPVADQRSPISIDVRRRVGLQPRAVRAERTAAARAPPRAPARCAGGCRARCAPPRPDRARRGGGAAAARSRLGLQLGPDRRPPAGDVEAIDDRGEVETGPGDQQRAPGDARRRPRRKRLGSR